MSVSEENGPPRPGQHSTSPQTQPAADAGTQAAAPSGAAPPPASPPPAAEGPGASASVPGAPPTAAPPAAQAPAAPGTPSAKPTAPKPHRERPLPAYLRPSPPAFRWAVLLVAVAGSLLLTYMFFVGGLIRGWAGVEPENVPLEKPFAHRRDNFSIQPPKNWRLHDRVPDTSLVIKGPQERLFTALIVVSFEIAPDRLEGFVKEHKSRLQHENPSIKWLDEKDDFISGMRAIRLVYECDYQDVGQTEKLRLKNLQYIIDNRPRFYRITCSVAAGYYERYLARFEASARSFDRLPLPDATPQPLPQPLPMPK